MFFCKYLFGEIPKVLLVKEIQAIQDTSIFLETGLFLILRLIRFCRLRLTVQVGPLFGSG